MTRFHLLIALLILLMPAVGSARTFGQDMCPVLGPKGTRQASPQVRVAPDGTVVLMWADCRGTTDGELYIATSTDGGMTFSTDRKLTDETDDSQQQYPSLSVAPDGDVYVAWQDDGFDDGDVVLSVGRVESVSSVATEGAAAEALRIRPNPVRTGMGFEIDGYFGNGVRAVEVYDIAGRRVATVDAVMAGREIRIPASPRNPGVYTVIIPSGAERCAVKLVVAP